MSIASDPSFSTTEVLIASVRRDLSEMSKRLREADAFAREAMATMWEIDRRSKATTPGATQSLRFDLPRLDLESMEVKPHTIEIVGPTPPVKTGEG